MTPARLDASPRADLFRVLPSGRSLLVGFGMLALAAGSYGVARGSSLFTVTAIEVDGAPPRVRAAVRRALRTELGTSLLALDPDAVVDRAEALPEIASAAYDRDFPHTLRLVVRPERPVAVLRRGRDSWLVSARGRVIRRLARPARVRLPRVWLPRTTRAEVGELIADPRGAVAVRSVAQLRATPLPGGVRGAFFSARRGLVFVLPSGVELAFGAPVELPLKLAIARQIVPGLPPRTTVLDLSVPERPVADPNPQPEG